MITPDGKVATKIIEGLNPITLFVVMINIMCLAIVAYTLHSVAERTGERDKLMLELAINCKPATQPQ